MTGPENVDGTWSEEQLQDASVRELAAGRLPIRAQQRLATMRADRSFTSNLSVDEHHVVRSVGFAPVGQVLGSCVYQVGYTGAWYCGAGPFGSTSQIVEASGIRQSLYDARQLALHRMRQECAGLGGDGVVAVRLEVAPFSGGGLEFQAIGTAVRAEGEVRPPQPFTSDLSGQDFAKLITAGWVPTALVLGVAVLVRHDDTATRWQANSWSNQEMTGYTRLVHAARDAARQRIHADCAAHGGSGIVIQSMNLTVHERECRRGGDGQTDHLAETLAIGTAITPFSHAGGNAPPPPLAMMRLSR